MSIAFKTPAIPTWIKEIEHNSYRNIFSFDLGNKNLWGTETPLGDWDGSFLLIAKDFYPSSYISNAVRNGEKCPYAHKPDARTNVKLMNILTHYGKVKNGAQNTNCDFLYISACFLLRDDGEKSGNLPFASEIKRLSAPVIKFTLDNMPNLKRVVLMGDEAATTFPIAASREYVLERKLQIFRVYHPAAAMLYPPNTSAGNLYLTICRGRRATVTASIEMEF